jgi:hypothetical protein
MYRVYILYIIINHNPITHHTLIRHSSLHSSHTGTYTYNYRNATTYQQCSKTMESLHFFILMIIISIAINAIVVLAQGVQTQTKMGEFDADMFHVTIEKDKEEEDADIKFKIVRKNKNNVALFTNFVLAKSATTTFYDASTSKFAPEGNDFTYAFNRLASQCPNQGGENKFGNKDTKDIQADWKFGVVKKWPSEWRYIYIIRGKGVKLTKSD